MTYAFYKNEGLNFSLAWENSNKTLACRVASLNVLSWGEKEGVEKMWAEKK